MQTKFGSEEKAEIVTMYIGGQSVSALCAQYGIARSTLYYWIQQYSPLRTVTDNTVYYKEYVELKRRTDKLEAQLAVLKAAGCGTAAPLQEKLIAIEKLYGQYSVHALCEALDVSRGTFYNHIFRRKDVTTYKKRREEMREHVRVAFDESKQRFGAKKICAVLEDKGIRTSVRYVTDVMREMNLQCIGRNSKREYKRHVGRTKRQNVLQQQFNVKEPNAVWVSDVTCFKVKDKWYYTCIIIDLFARKVIAHGISVRNSTYLITSTFRHAFESRGRPKHLTFHSDQGVQYTSKTFRDLLSMNNIVQSFSKSGSPHDNAVAEAFFACMKKEELYRTNYRSEREFKAAVDEYIIFYNSERPHGTNKYKTPDWTESQYEIAQKNLD